MTPLSHRHDHRIPTLLASAALAGAISLVPPPVDAGEGTRRDRFRRSGTLQAEELASQARSALAASAAATEAPTGFDNLTNGYLPQGPPFDTIEEDNVQALRSFNDNRFIFEEVEAAGDGLGPTFNAQSCRE